MLFPISFSGPMKVLLALFGLGPKASAIDVEAAVIEVRMGWAFHAVIPRSSIVGVGQPSGRRISRGVHGCGKRYLVNGSGAGLVTIVVDPPERARVVGLPVTVRELTVSVDDPDGFAAALG